MFANMAALKGLSIRQKIASAAAITILAFAAVVVAADKTTRDLDAARISVEEAVANLRRAARVERLFVDLEMGERAFVIAGDESLLAPYRRANDEIDGAIVELETAAAEPEQAQRIARVGQLLARWRQETAEPLIAAKKAALAAARAGGPPPPLGAEDLVRQQAGDRKVDEVRRELDRFGEAQRALVAERREHAEDSARIARAVAMGGGALAILVAASSAWITVREVTRPLAELARAAERIERDDLGERVAIRGSDEVGLLAAAFDKMIESIAQHRRDVTERAVMLQAILDHVDVGIALLDQSGKVRLANSRLPKVLQVAPFEIEEAGGLLKWIRSKATRPEQVESWQQQIARNPTCLIYETIELGPPRHLVVRVYGGPVPALGAGAGPGGPGSARILVFRDATREAEAERVKTEFISTVSHELRTPLTSVRGYVDLILGGDAGPVSDMQREFLGIVARNAERLSALINDLLDIEKIHAGKLALKREKVDLNAVLEGVVQTFRLMAQQKGLALEMSLEPVPPVLGDADRLTQVFQNLVSNAIKYTREGTVLIRTLRMGNEIRAEVHDTGIGLTEEERGRIFEKFFRADNSYTRSVSGTGLGLAIARAIVERHGARIEVASQAGRGSTFAVVFPPKATAAAAPATPGAAAAAAPAAAEPALSEARP